MKSLRCYSFLFMALLFISSHSQSSSSPLIESSCKTGFSSVEAIGSLPGFCISTTPEPESTFDSAAKNCESKGARLCSDREWYKACKYSKNSEILGLGTRPEWVRQRHSTYAEIFGYSRCDWMSVGYVEHAYGSRCCYR